MLTPRTKSKTKQPRDPCWQNDKLLQNEYNRLQQVNKENVTKSYKKSSGKVVEKLDGESAKIAENLKWRWH